MNELIASIIDRKIIIFANEGRLLKKCFLAIIILTLAFQQGALGEVVRASMGDAYLQVSVFVGFTLFIFINRWNTRSRNRTRKSFIYRICCKYIFFYYTFK